MNFAENDSPVALDAAFEIAEPEKGSVGEAYVEKRPFIKKPVDKRIAIIN